MTYQTKKLPYPTSDAITRRTIPTLKQFLERYERHLIIAALENNRFSRTKTAKELGIDRVWLYMKMRKYGIISPEDMKHSSTAHKAKPKGITQP